MNKHLNRPIDKEIVFSDPADGAFINLTAAQKWLNENGYVYGTAERDNPIAILKSGSPLPHKWSSMTNQEKTEIDGVIIPWGGIKYGNIRIRIFKSVDNDNNG